MPLKLPSACGHSMRKQPGEKLHQYHRFKGSIVKLGIGYLRVRPQLELVGFADEIIAVRR